MRRILVTRPQPGASRTAAALSARGFEALVLPLTRIVPIAPQALEADETFSAVAVSSANAVRHASPSLLAQISGLPVYAVGKRTGEAARGAGLTVADEEGGDAAGLVRRIAAAENPGTRILILCGRVRRDTVEQELAQAGFALTPLETYDTVPLRPSEEEVLTALERRAVDAVLLYSAVAAQLFNELCGHEGLRPLLGKSVCIAISERVAGHLSESPCIQVAREPNEGAMFSLLAKPGQVIKHS